jgi:hypothetical protein
MTTSNNFYVHGDPPSVEIEPVTAALIDAVKDVALYAEAPAADHAGRALVRLLDITLGHPRPEPVEREGGIVGAILGNPVRKEV